MIMKFRSRMHSEQGFTLIELIVVLAILAVLALLAIPRFADVLDQSKYKTQDENLVMIANAVALYYADGGKETGTTLLDSLSAGNYLKTVPTTPWGGTYTIGGVNTASHTFNIGPGTCSIVSGKYTGTAATSNIKY